MNVSRDTMLALQRHFLGALSAPSRTWLEPVPASRLVFSGSAVRASREGCVLDFGSVVSPGEEHHRLSIANTGPEGLLVRLADCPSWLTARFSDGYDDVVALAAGHAGATLELTVTHDEERAFDGSLRFIVDAANDRRSEELPVRMTARRSHPVAQFDFHGLPAPRAHDFGADGHPYVLSVANASAVPLVVSFSDLPAWLTFEVDGRGRSGPIAGRFFERAAPFTARIKPQFLGRQYGAITITTNDPRPGMQSIELRFAACLVPPRPCVRAFAPRGVRLRADQSVTAQARLENWGRSPARTVKKMLPAALELVSLPVVPAAFNGAPGNVMLPIRIVPARLSAGTHELSLTLRVEDGDPAEVDVPLHVEVVRDAGGGRVPAEMVAALVALLLLTLLFVFVVRGLS